jgi:hypothetical protein
MNLPTVACRDEWVAARKRLLAKEKEFARARDRLNAERRRLPMVLIDKEYAFDGPEGETTLLDLFSGRSRWKRPRPQAHPAPGQGAARPGLGTDDVRREGGDFFGARATRRGRPAAIRYRDGCGYR